MDVLARSRVVARLRVADKSGLLAQIAGLLAQGQGAGVEAQVLESLLAREALGSTGLGRGVALPHARLGVEIQATGTFILLDRPVDFSAPEGEPVDLIMALVIPERFSDSHLALLAQTAELLSNAKIVSDLRGARDAKQLFDRLRHHSQQFSEA